MTIDDDMNDMRLDSEETPPPGESGNRSFLIVAGILGAITILRLICIVAYAMFYLPRAQQQRTAQVATLNAQNTAVALAITRSTITLSIRKRLGCKEGDFPNATRLYQRAISLPLFPTMRPDDVRAVVRSLARIVGGALK